MWRRRRVQVFYWSECPACPERSRLLREYRLEARNDVADHDRLYHDWPTAHTAYVAEGSTTVVRP